MKIPFEYIEYQSGFKYQLTADYHIQTKITGFYIPSFFLTLNKDGLLVIRRGYAWDGPSGPTVDTLTFMRGSLVHDAFYQLLRTGCFLNPEKVRRQADKLLKEICLEDKMCSLRAWYVHRGVSRGAGFAADPANAKPVIYAPSSPLIEI